MKAVVLAAGKGERLFPFTVGRSKPLIPIAGRPLLWYVITALHGAGIREVVIVVSRGSDVKRYAENANFPISLDFVEQRKQLGTGDALLAARDALPPTGSFLVIYGDLIVSQSLIKCFLSKARKENAMAIVNVPDVSEYGAVVTKDGAVIAIREKALRGRGYINAGIYLLNSGIFPLLEKTEPSPRGEVELTDAIMSLTASQTPVMAVRVSSKDWCDVGRPWDIITATMLALLHYGHPDFDPPPVVREKAHVKRAFIGASAVVEDAKIVNSVIFDGATIASGARVSWSVVGERAYVGRGVTIKCKLPRVPVEVRIGSRTVTVRKRLIGAFIGREAWITDGTTVPPATVLAPGEVI